MTTKIKTKQKSSMLNTWVRTSLLEITSAPEVSAGRQMKTQSHRIRTVLTAVMSAVELRSLFPSMAENKGTKNLRHVGLKSSRKTCTTPTHNCCSCWRKNPLNRLCCLHNSGFPEVDVKPGRSRLASWLLMCLYVIIVNVTFCSHRSAEMIPEGDESHIYLGIKKYFAS